MFSRLETIGKNIMKKLKLHYAERKNKEKAVPTATIYRRECCRECGNLTNNKTDPSAVDRKRKWAGLQWDCPENKKGVV